jgi:hypothetical protein
MVTVVSRALPFAIAFGPRWGLLAIFHSDSYRWEIARLGDAETYSMNDTNFMKGFVFCKFLVVR